MPVTKFRISMSGALCGQKASSSVALAHVANVRLVGCCWAGGVATGGVGAAGVEVVGVEACGAEAPADASIWHLHSTSNSDLPREFIFLFRIS
jgi:hypothetical protein